MNAAGQDGSVNDLHKMSFMATLMGPVSEMQFYHILITETVWENNLELEVGGVKISFIKLRSQIMQVHLECNEVLHSYKPSEIDVAN